MTLTFTSTGDMEKLTKVKVLVYGNAGVGKTVLCSTAPTPLILSAESGLLALKESNLNRLFGPEDKLITYDIPVIVINNVEDLTEAYEFITLSKDAEHFETICLDSITEIAEQILDNAKRQVKDPRQAYSELLEKMNDTLKKFRDLSRFHVYFSAKQEVKKDEITMCSTFGASMPGNKLGQQVPYLFDGVYNLNVAQTADRSSYRYLRTQPDLQYSAKDRSGSLDEIEKPDLTHIFNKILGS